MTFPPILKLQSLNNGLKQTRELGKITIHFDLLALNDMYKSEA